MNESEGGSDVGIYVVIYSNQFLAPVRGERHSRVEERATRRPSWRGGDQRQERRGVRIDRNLIAWEAHAGSGGVSGAIRTRTQIAEVSLALRQRWYRNLRESSGHAISAPFFGPEEISLVLDDWATEGVAKIILLVSSPLGIEEPARIKSILAQELIDASVEMVGSGFRFHLDGAGTISAVLSPIIGGKDAEFSDGFDAGINVERAIAPVVHVVAAVEFPVVVLRPAAVHAALNVAVHAHGPFILTSITAHARREGDQLGEVAAVQLQLRDFPAGDDRAFFVRLCLHVSESFALDHDFRANRADDQGHVHARFLGDAEHHAFGFEFLKSQRSHD